MNSYEEDIKDIVHVIKGSCFGIVLSKRGSNDSHLLFTWIVKDDFENWFLSKNDTDGSVGWFEDVERVLKEAIAWVKENTDEKGDLICL